MESFALDASVLLRPTILCSGITSGDGELCLVSRAAGVSLEPCLLAIAAGDGREVMELDKDCVPACTSASRCAYPWASIACRQFDGGWANREHG